MRNKGLGGKKNDSYEKKCLLRSIDPMNFQFADRCHAVNYAAAIEKKIRYLNKYTNNGTEFFSTNIRFPIHTVYPLLVDFYHLIDDYLKVKDKYLYSKHRDENDMFTVNPQPKLDCEDCSYYSTVELLNNNNSYEFAERKKNCGRHLYC